MANNQNSLITGDISCTIGNLDDYLRFLCAAGEDADVCEPGLMHALRQAQGASSWLKQALQECPSQIVVRDQPEETRS